MEIQPPYQHLEPHTALTLYKSGPEHLLVYWKFQDGQPVSMHIPTPAWLERFLARLLNQAAVTYLHPRLIAQGPGLQVWWRPAQPAAMFFTMPALPPLSAQTFPHPPLLFIQKKQTNPLYALPADERPTPHTPLLYAPYPNYNPQNGWVCWGSGAVPPEATPEAWEQAFFQSAFSHTLGAMPLKRGNLVDLWQGLANKPRFPLTRLKKAGKTGQQAVAQVIRHA
jgi:PRTRC genetic system protein B